MTPLASGSSVGAEDARPDPAVLANLFDVYRNRHSAFETWSPATALFTWFVRPLGSTIFSNLATLGAAWLGLSVLLFLLAGGTAFITNTWQADTALTWAAVALAWGGFTWAFNLQLRRADVDALALHAAMSEVRALERLIAWDVRWFSHRVVSGIALAFVLLMVVAYVTIQEYAGWVPVPPGSLALGLGLAWIIGETTAGLVLLVAEYPMLAVAPYRLYRPDPASTPAIQRALRGHNAFAAHASIYMTATILVSVALLPPYPGLILPVGGVLLVLSYASICAVVVAPRILMSAIVRHAKEATMAPMRARLDRDWVRVDQLDPDEYERFRRRRDAYEELRAAPDDFLNVRSLFGKIAGSLLLPTLVTVLAAVLTGALGG